MNIKFRVRDLQGENFQLVQNISEVEEFNREYDEIFDYYFIEFYDDCACALFGSFGILLDSPVYQVSKFI